MKAFALVFSCAISGQAATGALPVPTDEAQAAALKIAKEIYGKEYAEAKGSEQKKALAESFLQRAAEARDDPPSHFVLLRLSRDVAALAGEAGLAQRAIDAMALTFDIDITPMKIETLLQTASRATSPEQHAEVVEFAEKLRDDAVETDDFAAATRLAEAALVAAKRTGDRALIRKVQERTDEVSELARAFVRLQQAAATLRNQPDDPAANLALGKYLCFQKGQWERGLPMLSLGDDPQLRELAVVELAAPSSAEEQKQLGDRWWRLAERAERTDETTQRQFQGRAAHWYRQALPGLTGLSKDVVEKRLASLPAPSKGELDGDRTTAIGPLSGRMMQHNRRIAEWVLSIGGSLEVRLQDQESAVAVKALPDLPKGVFVVTSISLFECRGLADRNLAGLVGLNHLRTLNLAGTKVSDAGLPYVGQLTSLEELYLGGTRVGDNGMRFVGNLTDLTFLGLFYTQITDQGLRHLNRLTKLQRINLGGTKASDAVLRSVLPNCAIERPR